jgi:hypothetical protein
LNFYPKFLTQSFCLFLKFSNNGKNRKGDLKVAAVMIGKWGMIIVETLVTVDPIRLVGPLVYTASRAQAWEVA